MCAQTGQLVDALCFTAADRLLEQPQKVLIPTNRPDYAAFLADLRHYAPPTLDFSKEADDIAPNPATTTDTITDKS